MSDLIGRIQSELHLDEHSAKQGAGSIFSMIKERVGLRTFQMLKVPFPDVEEWIDLHSGIEGYGAGDYFIQDLGLSGPAVDIIERATSSGLDLETSKRLFELIYTAIQREAIPAAVSAVEAKVPSPSDLVVPKKKRMRR